MQPINEDPDAVKPQSAALLVEVKVRVPHVRVPERVEGALVRLLDGALVPTAVDQVDEVLRAVERDLLREVAREGLCLRGGAGVCGGSQSGECACEKRRRERVAHRRREVEDLEVGLVPQVVDLGPVNRDAPPRLHKREPHLAPDASPSSLPPPRSRSHRGVVQEDELLGLVEVGHVAVLVDAAGEVARPGAEAVAARDEAKGERAAVERRGLEFED